MLLGKNSRMVLARYTLRQKKKKQCVRLGSVLGATEPRQRDDVTTTTCPDAE
jgi:hypothetical protein